jgi:lysophospholipase L1-like esterase
VALESQTYSVARPTHLRFGTPQQWVYADASGSFTCDIAFFKTDPNPGVSKQCQTDDPAASTLKVKVMPIGDSITSFYRDPLWGLVVAAGFTSVDFVGNSPYNYHAPTDPDPDYNGYGGYKAQDLLKPAGTGTPGWTYLQGDERDLGLWMQGQAPDVVMLEIGTNNGGYGTPGNPTAELAAYSKILAAARAKNPNVRFFVAQITSAVPSALWDANLNAAIPPWAAANTTAISPVVVVDQYTGFDAATMTVDGIHPNPAAAAQMAQRWMNAISPYLH